jgi:hypothetical protein
MLCPRLRQTSDSANVIAQVPKSQRRFPATAAGKARTLNDPVACALIPRYRRCCC